jgi:hypothetical protein
MTNAKVKFDKTIDRCKELIRTHTELKKAHENGLDAFPSQDILRAAIVLAVAAFDAYATDCFAEKFVVYIKRNKIDDSLEKLLLDSGFTVKFSLELLDTDRPYRKIRTLIDRHYAKYTTQKLNVVDGLFLQYRIKSITKNAAKKSGKNVDRILGSVNKIIDRRHSIVHDGDYDEFSRIKSVTSADIRRIGDLKILVDNMDLIVENRFAGR